MNIFIFRHAEKSFAATSNPPLSDNGHRQAEKLFQLVQKKNLIKPDLLLVSPKIRTVQTFAPLNTQLQIPLQQLKELDERSSSETLHQFQNKIKTFIQWLGTQNKNIYVATHFDWIEEAMTLIPCDTNLNQNHYHSWAPATFMDFYIQDQLWHLNTFKGVDEC